MLYINSQAPQLFLHTTAISFVTKGPDIPIASIVTHYIN